MRISPEISAYFGKIALAAKAPPHRPVLHLDFESWSECELPKTGVSVYAQHPTTEILMLAYGWSEGEIKQWVPILGEPMPDDLRAALTDPSITLAAWNAPFESALVKHVLGLDIPVERWLDVMALSYSLALPGKLSKCGEVVGLGEDKRKMARGTALVRRFCMPRKPSKLKPWTRCDHLTDPEDWVEFLAYNRQDVEAERAIYRRLKKYQMPDHEWALWHLDQKINNAGIPINQKAVEAAVKLSEFTISRDMAELRKLTGLANPNSNAQILPWLRAHGYNFTDLKKGHVERAAKAAEERLKEARARIDTIPEPLAGYMRQVLLPVDELLVRVLNLRLRVSKSSVKKYPALLAATDLDGMLRGCHQFAGAGRTWRWSGRRFQPQNLPKPSKELEDQVGECIHDIEHLTPEEIWVRYDNPMEVLTAGVRPTVQSGPGKLLVDADLSAIENVVLGWLAGDEKILRVFREGLDPYLDFATDMFGITYAEAKAEFDAGNKQKRTTAKPGVLGCGYLLGAGAERENHTTGEIEATGLLGYAWAMHVPLTLEMAKLSVETFRSKFKDVVKFWYALDKAVRRVIRTGKAEKIGYLTIDMKKPFLRIGLPSGRFLHYMRPRIEERRMPWGDMRPSITYENMENGQWKRVTTHPGKLTENSVQGVARDLLAHGMTLADAEGIDIRMHVHDQIIGLAPEEQAEDQLQTLIRCMTTVPPWADDKLPLKAAGFTSPIFRKD